TPILRDLAGVRSASLPSQRSLSPFSFIFFFFFHCSAPHRDLHSFPTRRSSDLHGRRTPKNRHRNLQPAVIVVDLLDVAIKIRKRSEEHTSELQSRFDLVCRLLLEKKKKKNNIIQLVIIYTQVPYHTRLSTQLGV